MDTADQSIPLIVIVGPTASGKSALGLRLAQELGGEIICADSRTVYIGMDIGTAKPSNEERATVPHHLLDVVESDETFTAAEFKRRSEELVEAIYRRGNVPIVVGGTGLYIDGLIFNYAFLPPVDSEDREELQSLSVEALQARINEKNIPMPENRQNKRHLVRALETNGAVAVKQGLRKHTLVLGIEVGKEDLQARVTLRTDKMISSGLESEVARLAEHYGWDAPGLTAVGYREWQGATPAEARSLIIRDTMQYAKRQRTWFRRNPHITWVKNDSEAERLTKQFIQQYQTK